VKRLGYDDWMTFDIVPKEAEPVEFFATAARLTRKYESLSLRIDAPRMEALQGANNPSQTLGYVHTLA
jgi:xylose isomerase